MDTLDLNDPWRKLHPFIKRYTWRQPTPLKQARLDFFLISHNRRIQSRPVRHRRQWLTAINHGFQPIRGEHCSSVVALDLFIKFARSTAVILNEARCVTIIVDTSKLTNVKW
jgi:hypothetical protein